ncbi:MAG: hypothetical protein ACYSTT_19195 [Planctomycetota bacterium]
MIFQKNPRDTAFFIAEHAVRAVQACAHRGPFDKLRASSEPIRLRSG